jgi:hypothetical protein
MKSVDYESLERAIYRDCLAALYAFCTSPNNTAVYVVAIQFDAEHGDWALALNTECGFSEGIVARYPDGKNVRQIGGGRWNPAEFPYFDVAPASARSKQLALRFQTFVEGASDVTAERHRARFSEALIRVIERLRPSYGALRSTEDFISYVWPIDAAESEIVELTRRTVPTELFDRLFPEVRATEAFIQSLAHRPPAEQAAFWAEALRDFVLENDTDGGRTLRRLGRTEFDARDALVRVGDVAIPELVRMAEDHALAEEWNARGSAEWTRSGASTRQGRVASAALLALQDFDDAPDAMIRRLAEPPGTGTRA